MLILPLVLLAVMMLLMWRGNKQRQKQMETMREKLVPGAEVMTQAGIFGTLVAIDNENHVATLEVSPGVEMRVHSQTVATVVEPTVPNDASSLTDDNTDATPASLNTTGDADAQLDARDADLREGELDGNQDEDRKNL